MAINFIISTKIEYVRYNKLLKYINHEYVIESLFTTESAVIDHIKSSYPNIKFNLWKDSDGKLYSMASRYRYNNPPFLYINGVIEPVILSEN